MKKNSGQRMRNGIVLTALMVSGLLACARLEEGCLDVYATNFEVDVDKDCAGCCTYPQLRIDVLHKISVADSFQNIALKSGVYTDGAGNLLRIEDIRFYLSAVHLVRSDGSLVSLQETLGLRLPDSTAIEVENNFALVTPTSLSRLVLGTFRKVDQVTAIRCTVGIGESARGVDPSSAPVSHPLYPQSIPMWSVGSGFVAQRLSVFSGISAADTIPVVFETTGTKAVQTLELSLPQPLTIAPGYHTTITLRVDYGKWLENIDIRQDPKEIVLQKLGDNMAASLSITQVVTSEQ